MDELEARVFPQGDAGGLDLPEAEAEAVASAFGRPYRGPDGKLIIPVARVMQVYRSGGRMGGEHRVVNAIPRAVIEVDEKGARIKEITNTAVLALAGMTLAAWNVYWITKTVRAVARKR